MQGRRYAEAEAAFRKVIRLDPSLAEAHVNLGLALHQGKKQKEAIKAFEQALRLQPKLTHAYLFLGINLFNLNRLSKALPPLQKYTSLAPRDAQGHYYLGLTFASQESWESAIQSLETASSLAPRDVDILYHLAQSYIAEANRIVLRLAKFNPSLPLLKNWEKDRGAGVADLVRQRPAGLNRDGQLVSEGRARETLVKLKPQLGHTPPNEQVEQLAAAAYADLYVETTQRFYRIEPNSFRIHQLLAAYYEKTKQSDKAIAELKQVIAINPSVRGVHFTLASIYGKQNQLELALLELREELKIASPYPRTRVQIALGLLTLQQPEKALSELLIQQKEDPEDGEVCRLLGKTYSELGQNEKAAESFEQAIARGETNVTAYYQLAHVYRKLGKKELAARYFDAHRKATEAELASVRARVEKTIEAQRRQQEEEN